MTRTFKFSPDRAEGTRNLKVLTPIIFSQRREKSTSECDKIDEQANTLIGLNSLYDLPESLVIKLIQLEYLSGRHTHLWTY